jgi:hypothetical protein
MKCRGGGTPRKTLPMSADNPANNKEFVTASQLDSNEQDGRECPHCGKQYDSDGRARAAFLRHVAQCDRDPQTRLSEFEGDASDLEVRRAVLEQEAER